MTMMAVCRAPCEVMVTIVMAMVHYIPVSGSKVVVVLVVYYRRANWQWHCWLWRYGGGVETNMQIKLAIIFFKHVFQRGRKIIPLANNDATAADIQTMMKFYSFTRMSRIFWIRYEVAIDPDGVVSFTPMTYFVWRDWIVAKRN